MSKWQCSEEQAGIVCSAVGDGRVMTVRKAITSAVGPEVDTALAEGERLRARVAELEGALRLTQERVERATEATRWLVVYILDPRDTSDDIKRSLIEEARNALLVYTAADPVEATHAARALLARYQSHDDDKGAKRG